MLNRLFTTGSLRPEEMTKFASLPSLDGQQAQTLIAPEGWSLEAADSFRQALAHAVPSERSAIEENTVPSFLWRKRARGTQKTDEKSVTDVLARLAGGAAYLGWKNGLWSSEAEASTFYDELRAVLLTRRLVLDPRDMAHLGLDWAYGHGAHAPHPTDCAADLAPPSCETLVLQNETIDAILREKQPLARSKWSRFCESSRARVQSRVVFSDTLGEWNALPPAEGAPRALINLMAFRQPDGGVDVTGLQQTARLAVLLLELHYAALVPTPDERRPLSIGFANLAGFLMSLGLAYDSRKARQDAASLAAIISSAATTASAFCASRLGSCAGYAKEHETQLRALRNRLRAAFGEENDYEHLAVRPQSLTVDSGVDLVLIAAARYGAEEASDAAAAHGLRHLQLTQLFCADAFAALAGASSQGAEAEETLARDVALGQEVFARRAHPALALAMARLGHDEDDIRAARLHITGYRTLLAAPGVSQALLAGKGFDEETLARLEKALQKAGSLREVFTPWVLGSDFCRRTLKLSAKELADPSLDILRRLGFSAREIEAAQAFACGHKTLRGLAEIEETNRSVFAVREDLTPEAQIEMAAALQGFIGGEVALTLRIPASVPAGARGALFLKGWELGLKSMTLHQEEETANLLAGASLLKRKTQSRTAKAQEPAPLSQPRKKRAPLLAKQELALTLKSKKTKPSGKEKRG